ncbi:Hypothetical protein SRAE_2000000100, partial [Strongyloides ratti]
NILVVFFIFWENIYLHLEV